MSNLYDIDGNIENHSNIGELDAEPAGALAYKWNDEVDDPRWITDKHELRRLLQEDATLSYTAAGLAYLDLGGPR